MLRFVAGCTFHKNVVHTRYQLVRVCMTWVSSIGGFGDVEVTRRILTNVGRTKVNGEIENE